MTSDDAARTVDACEGECVDVYRSDGGVEIY